MTPPLTAHEAAAYLRRIGLDATSVLGTAGDGGAPGRLDAATLGVLHRAHLRSVPFENLDIHRGVPIALGTAAIDKIVRHRRGGYCYELNGSFAALLTALGADVDLLEAQVDDGDGGLGIRFDHLCLLVTVADGRYLADVGFGDWFDEPLRWVPGVDQLDRNGSFRIEPDGDGFDVLRDGRRGYRVDPTPRTLADFEPGNRFHQSHESHFSSGPVCSLVTDTGRVTLRGTTLIETTGDGRSERELTAAEAASVLHDRFGI